LSGGIQAPKSFPRRKKELPSPGNAFSWASGKTESHLPQSRGVSTVFDCTGMSNAALI